MTRWQNLWIVFPNSTINVDKMSATEPVSVTTGQGWDSIPSILLEGDTALRSFLVLGTVRRL